jgi:hypothetical protein
MRNDIAALTGQPRQITVAGTSYDVHPLDLDDVGKLQSWVDRQFPDALDVAGRAIDRGRLVVGDDLVERREPYSMAQQQYLLKVAMDSATQGRRLIGTPEADALVQSAAGIMEFLFLSIAKGRPGFTRAEASGLFRQLNVAQTAGVFDATGVSLVVSDPKAGTPTSSDGSATTS